MTTETAPAALFGMDAVPQQHHHQLRPYHYLLITREIRHGAEIRAYNFKPDDYDYTVEGYHDLARARADMSFEDVGESGIFDNWTGEWVDEPDLADDLDMLAEGSAPYAARPANDPWRAAMDRDMTGPRTDRQPAA
ncbi:MAG: hypothetical protein ACRDUW_16370 [Pseudonocardiaceae bacterium]